jgi:hypothetical protein
MGLTKEARMQHHDLPCGCNTNGYACPEHAPRQGCKPETIAPVARWIVSDAIALISLGFLLFNLLILLDYLSTK